MISKEKFLKYVGILKEYNESNEKKNKALEVLFPSSYVYIDNGAVIDLILDLLSELTESFWEDNSENYKSDIHWFYYETMSDNTPLTAVQGETRYTISTWEELYDFILKNNR